MPFIHIQIIFCFPIPQYGSPNNSLNTQNMKTMQALLLFRSSSYWGGRSLPEGIDTYLAAILTAVIQIHKNIIQFNLNTKRLTLNPFPLCRKAILTMKLSRHHPRCQDYFDGHYFFPEKHHVCFHV